MSRQAWAFGLFGFSVIYWLTGAAYVFDGDAGFGLFLCTFASFMLGAGVVLALCLDPLRADVATAHRALREANQIALEAQEESQEFWRLRLQAQQRANLAEAALLRRGSPVLASQPWPGGEE